MHFPLLSGGEETVALHPSREVSEQAWGVGGEPTVGSGVAEARRVPETSHTHLNVF